MTKRAQSGLIYAITCKMTGKVYVGQTVQPLKKRIKGHLDAVCNGSRLPLHRAIRKYGWNAFEVAVLERCPSLPMLNAAESRWIAELGAFGPRGYNCTTGGEGFRVSEETRNRIAHVHKGKALSEAHRAAIAAAMHGAGNPFFGRKHKQKTIDRMKSKLSLRFTGGGNPFFGKRHTQDAIERMASARRGTRMHPNTRAGIAHANLGNQYTKGRRIPIEQKQKYSKLTVESVHLIRSNPKGLSKPALAKNLNVHLSSVYNVLSGRTWKEVA
jgi:group I intron endonuclease